jgi:hypothetical protein
MNTIRKFQQPLVNINRLMKSKSFSTIGNNNTTNTTTILNNTIEKDIGDIKDLSIHGLGIDSLKLAFNNFKQYILKNENVKLALGRWSVDKVSAEWEKKARYY